MSAFLSLSSKIDDHPFAAFHLEPKAEAGARRRGGVIVAPDVFGVDAHVRHEAERWARLGFEVLSPSLFDRCEPGFVAEPTPDGLQEAMKYLHATRVEDALSDIETCLDRLAARGPVFVVGYGYGGSLAYLAACRLADLAAVSSACGPMVPHHAGDRPRCPVICHFGEKDDHVPIAGVNAFAARRPDVTVHIYDAGHGFGMEGAPGHNLAAAKQARARTLALFEANGAA